MGADHQATGTERIPGRDALSGPIEGRYGKPVPEQDAPGDRSWPTSIHGLGGPCGVGRDRTRDFHWCEKPLVGVTVVASWRSKSRRCCHALGAPARSATSPHWVEQGHVMTTVEQQAGIRPFHVEVSNETLEDLRRRIAATRWPSRELVEDRSQGVQLATMKALARYWTTDYDLGRVEARLNALPQFTTEIDGVDIHFIHVRSPHPDALPLIMTHGWPGSVIELLETVGPLTDPTAHGGRAEDACRLVLPSLPGSGFSDEPKELGWESGRI